MAGAQIEVGKEVMCKAGSKPENFPVDLINTVDPVEENFKAGVSNVNTDVSVDRFSNKKRFEVNVGNSNKSVKVVLESGTEHEYRVGDLVWCQIRNDPWWPGQIHDPKDASDMASKYRRDGGLLVALFGNSSGSWCLPSQLEPFVPNFNNRMSEGKTKTDFIDAVNEAVDEVSRALDFHMTCNCVSAERRGRMARPVVANGGVRRGVVAPKVNVARLQLPKYEAAEVLSKLGRIGCFDSALEVGVVKGWLSAFYRFKGIDWLQAYREPGDSIEFPLSPRDNRGWSDDELVVDRVSSPRQRKKSKSSSTSSRGKAKNSCHGEQKKKESAGEDDEMNIKLILAAPDKGGAVSEMKAIRKKLELTSVILERYHLKFTDNEKARLIQEMKNLKERVEGVHEKVNALAENTSLLQYG